VSERKTKIIERCNQQRFLKMEKRGVWEVIDEESSQLIVGELKMNGYSK
jgi:hypothetical protein